MTSTNSDYIEGITPAQSSDHVWLLHGADAVLIQLKAMIGLGRRQLDVLTDRLDPFLFANGGVCSAISELARSHRDARIRILVKDPSSLPGSGHRLTMLQQRMPSKIEIRKLLTEPTDRSCNYVAVDRDQLIFIHECGVYDGFYNSKAVPEARTLLEEFDNFWQKHCAEIADLRRLQL